MNWLQPPADRAPRRRAKPMGNLEVVVCRQFLLAESERLIPRLKAAGWTADREQFLSAYSRP